MGEREWGEGERERERDGRQGERKGEREMAAQGRT